MIAISKEKEVELRHKLTQYFIEYLPQMEEMCVNARDYVDYDMTGDLTSLSIIVCAKKMNILDKVGLDYSEYVNEHLDYTGFDYILEYVIYLTPQKDGIYYQCVKIKNKLTGKWMSKYQVTSYF